MSTVEPAVAAVATAVMIVSPGAGTFKTYRSMSLVSVAANVRAFRPTWYVVSDARNPSESVRYVWNVPGTAELSTTVRSRLTDWRKRYQSAPCLTSRGSASNARAGFANSRKLRLVPGNGRDVSRLMRAGEISVGSYSFRRIA